MTAAQGGPDQQGPPQPYGYAPAPPPPGQGAPPEPTERPLSVRIGLGAFVATLVLGLIALGVQFADPDAVVDELRAMDDNLSEDTARTLFTVVLALTLALYAVQALVIWFAWTGRGWARTVLLILGVLAAVSGLAGVSGAGAPTTGSGFLTSMSAFTLAATLAGVVALALRPSAEWYQNEGRRRAAVR
ncbi:hypothetical protein [Trujillonella endophytica]|uniref:Uncharacterized protein n=1 Tax=Trujillonella endophytica TaxID=673521 RepID=A0A1H8UG02_9ACTN|nr:hypothetical protein [Trujillella endophytica]SEP02150.1 hypothetical protein SAMN05660991_02877 [Trujillella endophytica]